MVMFGKLGLKADYATEGKRKLYIFSFFTRIFGSPKDLCVFGGKL